MGIFGLVRAYSAYSSLFGELIRTYVGFFRILFGLVCVFSEAYSGLIRLIQRLTSLKKVPIATGKYTARGVYRGRSLLLWGIPCPGKYTGVYWSRWGGIPPAYCSAAIAQSCNGNGAAAAGGYTPRVLCSAVSFVLHLCAGSAALGVLA